MVLHNRLELRHEGHACTHTETPHAVCTRSRDSLAEGFSISVDFLPRDALGKHKGFAGTALQA